MGILNEERDCNDCRYHVTNSKYPEGIPDRCWKCLGDVDTGSEQLTFKLPLFEPAIVDVLGHKVPHDGLWPYQEGDSYVDKVNNVVNPCKELEIETDPVKRKTMVDCRATDKQVGGDHYQMPIQPIEFIVKNDLGYREGNVIKYVSRHHRKNGKQDIEKAIHYLEMILEDYK